MAESSSEVEDGMPTNWLDVPSFYIDGSIGSAFVRGIQRIVLGSITFNTTPSSADPTFKPVCELILTNDAVRDLVTYLQALPGLDDEA